MGEEARILPQSLFSCEVRVWQVDLYILKVECLDMNHRYEHDIYPIKWKNDRNKIVRDTLF